MVAVGFKVAGTLIFSFVMGLGLVMVVFMELLRLPGRFLRKLMG